MTAVWMNPGSCHQKSAAGLGRSEAVSIYSDKGKSKQKMENHGEKYK